MALSIGRALLAGAAGVAQYSNEEQQRRQKRLDRVAELQDRLNLDIAKSKYAAKYNRYQDNQKTRQALGKTDPNSLPGQILLGQMQTGLDKEQVLQLAAQGSRWDLEDVKEPTLSMPQAAPGGKAINPIQDWFNGYRGTDKSNDRLKEYQQSIGSQFTPVGDEIPDENPAIDVASPQAMQVPEGPVGGSIEPMGTANATQRPELETLSAQVPDVSDPSNKQFEDLLPKPKVEWNKLAEQEASEGGQKGKRVTLQLGESDKTKTIFIPSGMKSAVLVDTIRKTLADNSETVTQLFVDPETNETIEGDVFQTKPGSAPDDKTSPVSLVSITDYATFMDPDKKGQFASVFPEAERDSWTSSIGKDQGFNGWWDSTPDGLPGALGKAYLDSKNGTVEAEYIVNPDLPDTKVMNGFNQLWKAQAYLSVLGEEKLVEAINNGLDKSMFYGDIVNQFPEIEDLHRKLGITEKTNPSEFNKLTSQYPTAF